MRLVHRPLTPARWDDFEAVFRGKGCSVARGCWCMYYRQSGRVVVPEGLTMAESNRQELRRLVDAGTFTGLLAYRGKEPVGWVSFGPREDFAKLKRSPVRKPVDDVPVWSIVCFVVPAPHRGQGVARALLGGAIDFARRQGVEWLEAYPVDRDERSRDDAMWFGPLSMYLDAGFEEVARRKPERPVVRLRLRKARARRG